MKAEAEPQKARRHRDDADPDERNINQIDIDFSDEEDNMMNQDGFGDDISSIDSDEREFIENISWDTESDEEDIRYDDDIVDKLNKRMRDGLIQDS